MQSRSSIQDNEFPSEAFDAATESLIMLGYDKNGIVKDYKFSSKNSVVKLNALVFAHPSQRDLDDYASVTMLNAANGHSDEELVKRSAESSAPFHLIHRKDRFSLWASSIDVDTQKRKKATIKAFPIKQSIKYEQIGDVMSSYGTDIKPQRIIDVKQGRDVFRLFPEVNPLQLSFWAEEIRSKPLIHHFENAINLLRNHPAQLSNDKVTLVATQLLGLLIMADTGMLGENERISRSSLSELIDKAHSKFPHYFEDYLLLETYPDATQQAYNILQNIQYSGFVPDMLGDLYAVAYEPKVRKRLGNYDTPLYLTRRILEAIPVEYLSPQERVIADLTCGWGSFLIAGYERLSNLSDSSEIPLQHSLHGNDYDKFFTQLAKLGLIHTTSKDDWHIESEDIFTGHGIKDIRPNIIIGNPPFAGNRKQAAPEWQESVIDAQKSKRKRFEKANKFLEHAIEQLKSGGYLALIMPRSFTVSESGTATRKLLLEKCDVYEIWDLPEQVFKGVTVRTVAIIAQKRPEAEQGEPSQTCVRTRSVQPSTLKRFKSSGIYTASALVVDQSEWYRKAWKSRSEKTILYALNYKTILPESTWHSIQKYCIDLHESAKVTRGISIGTKRKDWGVPPKFVDFLPNVRHAMPYPYMIDYRKAKEIFYPDGCERPRLEFEDIFKGQKILLQYIQTPSWGKRVKLAIERRGFYPSEHFYVIAPTNSLWLQYELTNSVLAAILEWDVSNAWIIEHMRSPDIPSIAIDTIPIPTELSQYDCEALNQAFSQLEEEVNLGNSASLAMLHAQDVIDTILKAAYHLNEDTFRTLRQVIEWETSTSKSSETLDSQSDQSPADWFTSGIVDGVEAENGIIRLWIDGFDELQSVNIVPSMPGWMFRPGAAFLTTFPMDYARQGKIPSNTLNWGYFHPQPYMYMSEEELLTGISQRFATNSQ